LDPRHEESHYLRGVILLSQSRIDEATLSLRKAYRLSKTMETYKALLSCYQESGKLKEGILLAKEAFKLMPYDARAMVMMGKALADTGERDMVRLLYDIIFMILYYFIFLFFFFVRFRFRSNMMKNDSYISFNMPCLLTGF